jgi:F0F1-type ATP synthase delta subunit
MLFFGLVFIQILAFGIVIFILKKLMLGNTESAVNRLNESYTEINKKKEELVTKIQQIEQEYQKRKEEAERIGNEIKDSVEKDMNEKRDTHILKAKQEAERIVTEAIGMKEKIREDIKKEEQVKVIDYCEELISLTFKDIVKGKVNVALIENFLNELREVDMSHLPPMINEVEVVSTEKLSEETKAELVKIFDLKLHKKLSVKETVDPHLIGGAAIKFGNLVIDGSFISKLKETISSKKHKIEEKV